MARLGSGATDSGTACASACASAAVHRVPRSPLPVVNHSRHTSACYRTLQRASRPPATRNALLRQRCRSLATQPYSPRCRIIARAFGDPELRDAAKRLTKLFYSEEAHPSPGATNASSADPSAGTRSLAAPAPAFPDAGGLLPDLPLWRPSCALLPGMQQILHIHAPHYVHMLEAIFARPQPWRFGALLLPKAAANATDLGAPGAAAEAGSSSNSSGNGNSSNGLSMSSVGGNAPPLAADGGGGDAPLVGVLLEVARAVRLRDGKLLLLATAVARIKARGWLRWLLFHAVTRAGDFVARREIISMNAAKICCC